MRNIPFAIAYSKNSVINDYRALKCKRSVRPAKVNVKLEIGQFLLPGQNLNSSLLCVQYVRTIEELSKLVNHIY